LIISSLSFSLNCRLCWWNNKSRPLWAALFSDNLRTIISNDTLIIIHPLIKVDINGYIRFSPLIFPYILSVSLSVSCRLLER